MNRRFFLPALIVLPLTSRAMRRRRLLITLMFAVLACIYSIITPIFEISDEVSHYPVIDYIADNGQLPVQNVNRVHLWDWEAAQPPLYYALAALIVAPFNRDDMESHLVENPHSKVGIGLATDNHNFVLHDLKAERLPWKGTPLHVHLLRLFSVLLGSGAVWMSFTVARLTFPGNPGAALVAQIVTAFNPMFLAIVGSVNNDNMVIALVPLALAVTLTVWREGFAWSRVFALALLGTLAAAAKLSGTIVFIPAGLVIVCVTLRDQQPLYRVALAAVIFVAVWGALFGWWYARNLDLYDDPLGNDHMAQTVGLREEPISLIDLVREEDFSFYAAYWGWFGAVNILAPISLFYYAGALQFVGLAGFVVAMIRKRRDSDAIPVALLALTLVVAMVSLITWTLKTPASQGRLLFPFISIISTFTALGLVRLLNSRWSLIFAAGLVYYAVFSIFITIPNAFRLPDNPDALPDDAHAVDVQYGDIRLLGYKIGAKAITPENRLDVTLYWQPLAPTDEALSFYVQVFAPGVDGETVEVAKLDSYPGRGLLRTDTWDSDVIYADSYRLEFDEDARKIADFPFEPRLKIGWRDNETDAEIPAMTASGESIDSVILRGGRVWNGQKSDDGDTLVVFGNVIRLRGFAVTQDGDGLHVHLRWQAIEDVNEDFTVFVQVIDPANPSQILASGDSVPRSDWWRTSLWIPGEIFDDAYTVSMGDSVEPGDYRVLIGFYRPADFTRLAVDRGEYPDAYGLDVSIK